jgi:hypothetical protein
MKLAPLLIVTGILSLHACSSVSDTVGITLANRVANDGQRVLVAGRLRIHGGYYSLHSRNPNECVGLLLTDRQRQDYEMLDGKTVQANGTFELEGCGYKGVCNHNICSPDILTHVEIILK